MANVEHASDAQIARKFNVGKLTVATWRKHLAEERRPQSSEGNRPTGVHMQYGKLEQRLTALGRCKCGLLLPCWSCVPRAADLALSRSGPGDEYPEGG